MTIGLRLVDTGVAREAEQCGNLMPSARSLLGRTGVRPDHVPRRIADHGIEATIGQPPAFFVEEHFRKLELPMKEPVARTDRVCGGEALLDGPAGERASTGENRIAQRSERRRRELGLPEPGRAPDVGDALPARHRRVTRGRSGKRAFFGSNLIDVVAGRRFERKANRQCRAKCIAHRLVVEQRQRRPPLVRASPPIRWLAQVGEPRPEQAVSGLEAMIQKRERAVGGKRREPERQPRQLNGHRVQIHAVQAAFRDRAPDRRPFGFSEIARVAATLPDERFLVRAGKITACRDEKGAASHGRVDDSNLEDARGGELPHQRPQRASHDVVSYRLWRVERPCCLADARSGFEGDRGVSTTAPRRCRARRDARLVVEQRFVDRAQLLNAQIPVGDRMASGPVRRRLR